MKNILFLVSLLVSNIAFGQNKPITLFLENFNTQSAPDKLDQLELQQYPGIAFSTPDQKPDIYQMAGEPFDLIQQNDSIYLWKWDTLTGGWLVNSKYVDIKYDADHFLISQTQLSWNGTEWANDRQYIYTYDEDKQ
jgi:hypothetical protein